jgi:hypothetical protein
VAAVMVVLVAGAAAKEAAFTLAPLPYAYDALEPHIDTLTMQLHHVRIQPPPPLFSLQCGGLTVTWRPWR